VCFKNTLAETHSKSHPIQSPLYIIELPIQVTHNRITFNTVKELSQFKQYKHFYTKDYKGNKEKVYKLSLMIKSVKKLSQSNESSSSNSRKQFFDENIG